MNYLQLSATTVQKGVIGPINHLGFCVELEQAKISEAVKEHGFWYVDIPRTSSSSIQYSLGQQFGFPFGKSRIVGEKTDEGLASALLPPHTPAYLAREIITAPVWKDSTIFSVVRNPYSWCVSLWGYTRKYGSLGLKNGSLEEFLKSMQANLVGPKERRPFTPAHFQQVDYLADQHGNIIVDDILKFEDRDQIDAFLTELGVAALPSQRLMSSDTSEYRISDSDKKLIHTLFEKDFEILGY